MSPTGPASVFLAPFRRAGSDIRPTERCKGMGNPSPANCSKTLRRGGPMWPPVPKGWHVRPQAPCKRATVRRVALSESQRGFSCFCTWPCTPQSKMGARCVEKTRHCEEAAQRGDPLWFLKSPRIVISAFARLAMTCFCPFPAFFLHIRNGCDSILLWKEKNPHDMEECDIRWSLPAVFTAWRRPGGTPAPIAVMTPGQTGPGSTP